MAEDLQVINGSKQEQYEALLPQVKGLLDGEPDLIANLANVTAALKEQFGWLWVGFYLVKQEELVLGPFPGTHRLHAYPQGQGRVWDELGKGRDIDRPRCGRFPGPYCL